VLLLDKPLGLSSNNALQKAKWLLQAEKAGMAYAEFYKFVMDTSLVDYAAMYTAALPAKAILDAADRVHVKGPGSGRDTALRSIQNLGIEVSGIKDVTPVPHNGCLQPKRRRS
jgi:ribosomal protein S11